MRRLYKLLLLLAVFVGTGFTPLRADHNTRDRDRHARSDVRYDRHDDRDYHRYDRDARHYGYDRHRRNRRSR